MAMLGLKLNCKRLQLLPNCRNVGNSMSHLRFLHNAPVFTKTFFSSLANTEDKQKQPFTVSYLINSCGLSLQTAKTLFKRVQFETPERPDSVLSFLRDNGFTDTYISRLVKNYPLVLLVHAEKTLLPKLEFLRSIGISSTDLARVICSNPRLLMSSLKKTIIPCYDFVKTILVHDEKVAIFFKRTSWAWFGDVQKNMAANISVLRGLGMPESCICYLVTCKPSIVCEKADIFDENVKKAIHMGFNPLAIVFVNALKVISKMKKPNWMHKMDVFKKNGWTEDEIFLAFRRCPTCFQLSEKNVTSKFEVYQRWGWSKSETLIIFKKHPTVMCLSEDKITRAMEFLVNKMGWPSDIIARNPTVLRLSLESRIIPRCLVVQVLLLKGFIKKDLSIGTFLLPAEKIFLEKYVAKFQQNVPQLLNVYQGKVDPF